MTTMVSMMMTVTVTITMPKVILYGNGDNSNDENHNDDDDDMHDNDDSLGIIMRVVFWNELPPLVNHVDSAPRAENLTRRLRRLASEVQGE